MTQQGHARGDTDAVERSRTPICLMCVQEGGSDIYRRLLRGKATDPNVYTLDVYHATQQGGRTVQ